MISNRILTKRNIPIFNFESIIVPVKDLLPHTATNISKCRLKPSNFVAQQADVTELEVLLIPLLEGYQGHC